MSTNGSPAYVVGVGMTKFHKPLSKQWDYPDMAREAGTAALRDAGIPYSKVKAVVASYCYGEPTSGQRAVYELGLSGVPVFNVNNNCSSGSTALMMARRLVQSGVEDCVLALGFEKMEGGLSERYTDRISPVGRHMDHMVNLGATPGVVQPRMNNMTSDVIKLFAYAAREYMQKYPDVKMEDLVNIAFKNRKHGLNNPYASLPKLPPKEVIGKKMMLCYPLTFWMTAPTADGSAAAIVCSEAFMKTNNLENKAVEIIAQHMVTDLPSSFEKSYIDLSGVGMARTAAERCYADSGLRPRDVDVLEVHDCFSSNELLMYEALQLAPPGRGSDLIRNSSWRRNANGGDICVLNDRWVVNPSGGLESKGHPIGATGLAQCAELSWQLRGEAGKRQVDGARVAMQHNFGIGGAAVVTMYRKYGQQLTSKL
ncbi:sterol carrier protein 2-like [Haliotis cracherodii]|uniref:sterol carrier protein 2-like n=1 Tax=Haliotis cracherodii TaxID=6455 RepID=UPI0039EB67B2